MLNIITKKTKDNMVTFVIYIDLSKAFDCLQYDEQFIKMTSLGCTKETLKWFKSYLSNRTQFMDVNGKLSNELNVKLAVPQGSILGLVLLLIYINDISNSCPFLTLSNLWKCYNTH